MKSDRETSALIEPLLLPPDDSSIQPLAVRPAVACKLLGVGSTTLYELLGAKELSSYYIGRARYIPTFSILQFIGRRMAVAGGDDGGRMLPGAK